MKYNIGCVIEAVIVIVIFAICIGLTYLIATSDLPLWMKFWLLK